MPACSPWFVVPVACAVPLAACGARSELSSLDGSGGAAPSSSSTTTTATTTGAGGGEPIRCDTLVADASISPPPTGTDAQLEHEPGLVRVDAERVILFAGVIDQLAAAETLRGTTFEAWGAWPSELGASNSIAWALRDGSIQASGGDGTASLLLPLYSLGPEGATTAFLAPRIEPSTDYVDPPGAFLFEIAGAGRPSYLRRTSDGFAAGWVSDFGGASYLGQLRTDDNGSVVGGVDYESGCATTRVRADAIEVGGQLLRAHSSGRAYRTCPNDDGVPGPGLRLQTDVVGRDDFVVPGDELVLEEPIAFVALLPRGSDGAWLVFRTDGSTSFAPPPLVAVPLDAGGRVAGERIQLFESSFSAQPVAVAPFGSGFAAAWIEMGETSSVAVRIFDALGQPLAGGGFDAEAIDSGDRMSLLASDEADALLVGWTHFGDRAHVTRLRCVNAP